MKLAWDHEHQEKNQGGSGTYNRVRSADPYHTARWTRLSREWRRSHPLCEECRRNGVVKAAEVTDHIVPWPVCQDFFDRSNLQSLCQTCNIAKGNRDKVVIAKWRQGQEAKQ